MFIMLTKPDDELNDTSKLLGAAIVTLAVTHAADTLNVCAADGMPTVAVNELSDPGVAVMELATTGTIVHVIMKLSPGLLCKLFHVLYFSERVCQTILP